MDQQAALSPPIRPRERDAVLGALRSGVVPRTGLQHVQVGRAGEVAQVVADVAKIKDGGSAVRFVIGDYGTGKTFFLSVARYVALQAGVVTAHADLSPDRRLHSASGGQARALCSELMRNLSTRTRPDGGALPAIVERFVGEGGDGLVERLSKLREYAGGHDLSKVVTCYEEALASGNDMVRDAALRWLRAEYALKTEAREMLGVRSIVDDGNVLDHLKAVSALCVLAGYGGLLVVVDECVNLCRLTSAVARSNNYEQVLRVVNDTLQGTSSGIGFYFGGTPEFLTDGRRGLWSYEALRSRLAENPFAANGLVDLTGPVLRLPSLTPEELYVLLGRLLVLFPSVPLPDTALTAFMQHCSKRVGSAYFRTPRNVIKAFLDLLSVLEQNPTANWQVLLDAAVILPDVPAHPGDDDDMALGSFEL